LAEVREYFLRIICRRGKSNNAPEARQVLAGQGYRTEKSDTPPETSSDQRVGDLCDAMEHSRFSFQVLSVTASDDSIVARVSVQDPEVKCAGEMAHSIESPVSEKTISQDLA
jgi:hypothetical protein